MRYVPVDVSGRSVTGLKAKPKLKDRRTGEVAVDPDGVVKWTVIAFLDDVNDQDEDTIQVTIASAEKPSITRGQEVVFTKLQVMHWEQGGRSGLAWSADSVSSAGARRGSASE